MPGAIASGIIIVIITVVKENVPKVDIKLRQKMLEKDETHDIRRLS